MLILAELFHSIHLEMGVGHSSKEQANFDDINQVTFRLVSAQA